MPHFFSYTRLNINTITLIITIVIFLLFNFIYETVITTESIATFEETVSNIQIEEEKETKENIAVETPKEKVYKNEKDTKISWSLEIPIIDLKAEIAEGTTEDVMNKYIGHFQNTSKWEGNIGLAAHNRRISSKLFWKT